ncbi:bifunctional thymidylate/uridylate kinase Ecym_3163 [Eremothecium cymbalariae DBVPG|uniref:Thymidylate kinase n=1 Tax=Eremothecium cymbalariae (strain CBS 270.75 / DBVPG 7215 / KCTC 17166 / NRRL Y-17582) TaxID=931890 RepID=G8JR97_ERECY|nr:Hypothetical protein Ecym_3163 [Eremothecium cymbalariae DBVPG\
MRRGRLILIEGLDRTGKSTQATLLLQRLQPNAQLIKFPDRTTPIGMLIDKYLTQETFELPDQAAHLLFSANRWELGARIKELLLIGTHVILDRYVYSGIAYSAAKNIPGMDLAWCFQPDKGLVKPDLTIFFLHDEKHGHELENRSGYGNERYERVEFQRAVLAQFQDMFEQLEHSGYREKHLVTLQVSGKSIDSVANDVWNAVERHLKAEATDFLYF